MNLWTNKFKAKEVEGWAILVDKFFQKEEIYEVHVDEGLARQRVDQLEKLNSGSKTKLNFSLIRIKVYVKA